MLAWLAPDSVIPDAPKKAVEHGVKQVGEWLNYGYEIGGVKITVGSVLFAVLLLVLFMVASAVIKFLLRRYGNKHGQVNQSSIYTIERVVHYLLMVIGILVALNVAGVPMAKMTVFAGALGVGLGFGLQAIFNNFVSGLILLFERTLKVGDFVELASGVHGHVRDIHIRATRITTNDDIDILVPNSEFVNGRVVNWTLREVSRRIKVEFGVAYGTDKELVKKAALEAAAEVPFTLTNEGPRAPQVWLTGFGDSSLDFKLVVWLNAEATRRPGAVTAAYYWALHTALEKYEIEIPFPQRDLHVRTWRRPPEDGEDERAPRGPDVQDPGHRHGNDAVRDVEREIAEASPASTPADDPHAADGGNEKK
ncbi:mechanosensitive ion channel [Oleiagrimonas citrea]|uniref:Mechanosensitive ion channel n=1 Tax=Oleiagrimonas citrea TaxID=1665687 RepID=A0A846ZP63_9GAMM|nr:mechanosensitive ion channel domain-containing protein [Oleiagrimonas citrea]NKZ39309.1 mechanosensitive ion channel [Oleiagrimonas citrea]